MIAPADAAMLASVDDAAIASVDDAAIACVDDATTAPAAGYADAATSPADGEEAADARVADRSGAGLRWLAIALCLVACAIAAAVYGSAARSARRVQSALRAQVVADALATRISQALALGVPFDRLQGVEGAFAHELADAAAVRRIALVDADETVVRQAGLPIEAARAPALLSVRTPVHVGDASGRERTVGAVVVYALQADGTQFAWEIGMLLAAAACVGALTLSACWRWAFGRGPVARLQALGRANRLAAAGDWTALHDAGPSERDRRVHDHAARVHRLVERYGRVDRLAASLVNTEPDALERIRLTQLRRQAKGDDRFPARAPDLAPSASPWHDLRLTCFMMLAASESLRLGAGRVGPASAAWLIVLYAASAAAGQAVVAALARAQAPRRAGLSHALVAAAAALIGAGWLVVCALDSVAAVWGGRALASAGAGTLIALASAFRAANAGATDRSRADGVDHAIVLAGEWVGPLLGFTLATVLGPAAPWLLLALASTAGAWVSALAMRQRPWHLRWPERARLAAGMGDDPWGALAAAGRGAFLAWLCARTSSSLSHDSLLPAAWWLAYGAGTSLLSGGLDAVMHRIGTDGPRRRLAMAAVLAVAAFQLLPAAAAGEDMRGLAHSALGILAMAGSLAIVAAMPPRVEAATGHRPHWLALAAGALAAGAFLRIVHAA
jgi:hypothetical protein